jgi:hypothetical protein
LEETIQVKKKEKKKKMPAVDVFTAVIDYRKVLRYQRGNQKSSILGRTNSYLRWCCAVVLLEVT